MDKEIDIREAMLKDSVLKALPYPTSVNYYQVMHPIYLSGLQVDQLRKYCFKDRIGDWSPRSLAKDGAES